MEAHIGVSAPVKKLCYKDQYAHMTGHQVMHLIWEGGRANFLRCDQHPLHPHETLMWPIGYCISVFIQNHFVLFSSSRQPTRNPQSLMEFLQPLGFTRLIAFVVRCYFQFQSNTLCEHAFSIFWLKNWIQVVVHGKSGTS